jgi:hypothetical protein
MTKEQIKQCEDNTICRLLSGCTFNQLYASGERSRKVIKSLVVLEVANYCRSQGWDSLVANYHIKQYGMKTLNYWFTRYKDTLKR